MCVNVASSVGATPSGLDAADAIAWSCRNGRVVKLELVYIQYEHYVLFDGSSLSLYQKRHSLINADLLKITSLLIQDTNQRNKVHNLLLTDLKIVVAQESSINFTTILRYLLPCADSRNLYLQSSFHIYTSGRLCGIMTNMLDCGLGVSEFDLQSCNYVYFRTNALRKDMNPFILPSYGLDSIIAVFLQGGIWL